jgi:hypothetical protein
LPLAELSALGYEKVADLDFPVQLTARPGASISYVITKDGRVWAFQDGEVGETPVLDISNRVRDSGEQGLLSIALSEDSESEDSEFFYLHYSDGDGDTVVSEFHFDTPTVADADSERILLRVDQPAGNHNGGMIQLIEGTLYVGLGDGGGAGDGFGNGQNTDTLLGGIVTLSIVGDPDPTLFAYGLRNPWRFWIEDDLIYIADVGQNIYEEVSVAAFVTGINYGWPITEGLHCFSPSSGCDPSGTVLPVVEVSHADAGTCSITGGVVYRGQLIPELDGFYLYSDYCGGYLRSFRFEGGEAVDQRDWTDDVGVPGRVTGFGVDGAGEVYVITTTALLRLVGIR